MSYIVNLQLIADELDFDLEDVQMLFELFLKKTKSLIAELDEGIETEDFDKIFRVAHAIKGSAGNLMLDKIADVAEEIEASAKKEKQIDYKKKFNELHSLIKTIEVC